MRAKSLGLLEGWLSVTTNVLLFGLKLWAGLASGSVAMTADAWHTLSDSMTSAIVIGGFWVSGRSADEKHPFGHGRAENIGAIIISTILVLVGLNFLVSSAGRFWDFQPPVYSRAALIIFLFSAVFKESFARFALRTGRSIGSGSVTADGYHHRIDAITTAIVLAGVLIGREIRWVDPSLGVIVSLLIIYTAYGIIKDTSGSILGERMSPELEKKIMAIINKGFPEVSYAHHFHLHRYGDHSELTFHAHLPDDLTLRESHAIVNRLEKDIRDKLKIETTIHAGPLSERKKDEVPSG